MTKTHPPRSGEEAFRKDARVKREVDLLATIMDDLIKVPGTNFGVGLDGIIGLIPGVGDSVTTAVASVVMGEAVRRRVPVHVIARMGGNLLVDTALGYIPAIGDAADFAHRANRKNYKLLKASLDKGQVSTDPYHLYMLKAVGLMAGVLLVMIASAVFMLWLLITGLGKLF